MFKHIKFVDSRLNDTFVHLIYRITDSCFVEDFVIKYYSRETPSQPQSSSLFARAIIGLYKKKKLNVAKNLAQFFWMYSKYNLEKAYYNYASFLQTKNAEKACKSNHLSLMWLEKSPQRYFLYFHNRAQYVPIIPKVKKPPSLDFERIFTIPNGQIIGDIEPF